MVIYRSQNKTLEKAILMDKSIKATLTKKKAFKENNLIVLRESSMGLGVFAKQQIPANHFIFRIQGSPLHFDATTRLGDKESYCFQTGSNEYLYLKAPFCYCNHSCDPNCGIRDGGGSLYTIKPIPEDEELCWDYSTSMLERHWTMRCNCKSMHCRSVVKDFDFLPSSLQERYLAMGIVMPFIEREVRGTSTREIFFLSRTGT